MPSVPRPRSLVPGRLAAGRRRAGQVPWIPEVSRSTAIVDWGTYVDGVRRPDCANWQVAIDQVEHADAGFVWIGLHEPSQKQLDGIAERLGLHPLAVEDAVHAHQRPKLEQYDGMLFAVVKTVHYDTSLPGGVAEVIETGEVMVFIGPNYVITVRHGEHGSLREIRHRLQADPELLAGGPSVVLHAILDQTVDGYLAVARALQDDIDEAESAVFTTLSRRPDSETVYALKREVVSLRRASAPLAPALRTLSSQPNPLISEDVRNYFRDVDDHLSEVVDQVNAFDDLLTSLISANLAQVSVQQNSDMRKISAWVAIAAVPTMVAGIYGMNFDHMPELHWRYGYPLVAAVTALFCFGLFRAFKKNGWL
jgi:magnesium transporter